MLKVSYQGIEGAYSHLACYNYFGRDIQTVGTETFEEAMELVEKGETDYALIPIENKTSGRVDEFYGLIPKMRLQIIAEHCQRIEHYLLGVEGSSLDTLEYVYSHPQGLSQCKENIKKLGLKPIARYDTAGSAKEVSELKDIRVGAIASSLAGEIYGLKVLKLHMQDQKDNFTRFIVLANGKETQKVQIDKSGEYITSIIFKIKNIPSALYRAIGGFAKNSVNILKIESYIPLENPKETKFHIDIDGSPDDIRVKEAINELREYVTEFRVLGVYRKNRF